MKERKKKGKKITEKYSKFDGSFPGRRIIQD
jgi:hypothetical protein